MNNGKNLITNTSQKPFRLGAKWKDLLLIAVLGLALWFVAWGIFKKDDKTSVTTTAIGTENERKISRLLEEIDGVGKANVVICETEDGVTGVVVVCEGANDFQVVIDVREAVAAALNVEQKAVKIYLKKD